MPGDNLPDDWGMYYKTCDQCNQRYHLSGCEVCACAPCATEECDTIVNTNEENICVECVDAESDIAPEIT